MKTESARAPPTTATIPPGPMAAAAVAATVSVDLDLDLDLDLKPAAAASHPGLPHQHPPPPQHVHAHQHPNQHNSAAAVNVGANVGGNAANNPRRNKRVRVSEDARRRAVRACVGCRRLKEKCNGRQPCERCTRSGRPCTFSAVILPGGGEAPGPGPVQPKATVVGPMAVPARTSNTTVASSAVARTASAASSVGTGVASVSGSSAASSAVGTATAASVAGAVGAGAASASCACGESRERVECLERIVGHFLGDVPIDVTSLHRIVDRIGSTQRANAGMNGAVGGQIDREELEDLMLEEENFTVKTLSQSTAHYSGEFSHWNFSQKLRRRLSECLDGPRSSAAWSRYRPPPLAAPAGEQPGGSHSIRDSLTILEYWRATQLQLPKSTVLGVVGRLPPRPIAEFLVHIYFRFAQTNSFFVEEGWLRHKLDVLFDSPSAVTSGDAAWVCSVLMVLAIGTQFAHMAAGPPSPDATAAGQTNAMNGLHDLDGLGDFGVGKGVGIAADGTLRGGDEEEDVGKTFYQNATKLIPDIITIASLESVQACLLLAHYVMPLDTHGLAYTYLGLGIKMAVQNGMHRRYTGAELDPSIIETRNRLWWTAYTVERRISVLHGRPASIAPSEMDAELPKDLPEFRQYDAHSKFENMSALIHLTLGLGDIANAITLLRRCPKALQATYFERILLVRQKLQSWWSSLPLEIQHPTPTSPMLRSNAHLKLCFHLTQIFTGRPFIFFDSKQGASPRQPTTANATPPIAPATLKPSLTSSQQNQKPPPSADTLAPEPSPRPSSRAAMVSDAVNAALEVIDVCRLLHETTGLAGASYTEFSSCRAALLLLLAQSLHAPTDRIGDAIALGMRLIKIMASGGNNVSTRSEASVIEAIERAVRRLHLDPSGGMGGAGAGGAPGAGAGGLDVDGVGDGPGSSADPKSGYERFKEWTSLWKGAGTASGGNAGLGAGGNGSGDLRGGPDQMLDVTMGGVGLGQMPPMADFAPDGFGTGGPGGAGGMASGWPADLSGMPDLSSWSPGGMALMAGFDTGGFSVLPEGDVDFDGVPGGGAVVGSMNERVLWGG